VLLAAGTVVALVAAAWLLFSGPSGSAVAVNAAHGAVAVESAGASFAPHPSFAVPSIDAERVVVEVNGAVRRPGIYRLPPASRVGDAISAAGGYGGRVDAIAAQSLNLAAKVEDGQQIHVPARGELAAAGSPVAPGAASGVSAHQPAGPINVNTASASELDTLPGVGPATAAKIISARAEKPFASVDELRDRKVHGAATLEKIRDLVVAN
jgi:competence protein ComEA